VFVHDLTPRSNRLTPLSSLPLQATDRPLYYPSSYAPCCHGNFPHVTQPWQTVRCTCYELCIISYRISL